MCNSRGAAGAGPGGATGCLAHHTNFAATARSIDALCRAVGGGLADDPDVITVRSTLDDLEAAQLAFLDSDAGGTSRAGARDAPREDDEHALWAAGNCAEGAFLPLQCGHNNPHSTDETACTMSFILGWLQSCS